MPFDHDQIDNLDAVIDGLDTPTSLETWQATDPYDAGMVAASAVRRALAGGGGGASSFKGVYSNSDGEPSDGPYEDGDFYIWMNDEDDPLGILIYGTDSGWARLPIALPEILDVTKLTVETLANVEGMILLQHGLNAILGTVESGVLPVETTNVSFQVSSGATLPLAVAWGDVVYLIKNVGVSTSTISSEVPGFALGTGMSLPLTVAAGVNDTFVYTPSGGDPETFTVAPGTYQTGTQVAAAMNGALGSVSLEPLSTYLYVRTDQPFGNALVASGLTLGADQNGDTLSAGPTDVLVDLGYSDPTTLAGGGFTEIDGEDTVTLDENAGMIVQWDDANGTWRIIASHGLS